MENDKCLQLIENYKKLLEKKNGFDFDKINIDNIKNVKNFVGDLAKYVNVIRKMMELPLMSLSELKELKRSHVFRYNINVENADFVNDINNGTEENNIFLNNIKAQFIKDGYEFSGSICDPIKLDNEQYDIEYKNGISDLIKYMNFQGYDFSDISNLDAFFDTIRKIRPIGLDLSSESFSSSNRMYFFYKIKKFFDFILELNIRSLSIGSFNSSSYLLHENNFDLFLEFIKKSKIEDLSMFGCNLGDLLTFENYFDKFFDGIINSRIQILNLECNRLDHCLNFMRDFDNFFAYIGRSKILELDISANSLDTRIKAPYEFELLLDFIEKTNLQKIKLSVNEFGKYRRDDKISARIEKMKCKIIF